MVMRTASVMSLITVNQFIVHRRRTLAKVFPAARALPYCDLHAGQLKAEAIKVVPWFYYGVPRTRAKRLQRTLA
jgi:hypothetical protein